jgi:hypothetical protein
VNSFILALHTTVFQAEIYAIKACKMNNTEESYRGRISIFYLIVKRQLIRLIISK